MKDPLAELEVPARRTGLFVAAAVAAAIVGAVLAPKVAATVAVMASLIVMIILHEAGHYVMAKKSGMKVTEFFVGFGPRLWSFRRGETEYGIKAVPLGGYVRIIGMNSEEGVDPELVSTEGTVDGSRFRFAAAHFEWLVRFGAPLGLGFAMRGWELGQVYGFEG